MRKIYTKKGDGGTTSVVSGGRLAKNDNVIHAIGDVDELNCNIGLLRSYNDNSVLETVQNTLFDIGAELAKAFPSNSKNYDVEQLESAMDTMCKELEPLKNFLLPGGPPAVAHCHIARAVSRRSERSVVLMGHHNALKYLNRLSDYLFVLARYWSKEMGHQETIWVSHQ